MTPSLAKPTLLALALGLSITPDAALAYTASTEMIPMRDGAHLATDVYSPDAPGAYPIVLIRTPYNKGTLDAAAAEILCDTLEFVVVMQDTRGRYQSEGLDQVFFTDGWGDLQDGYDTIDWLASQPFSDGNVGMMGVSAMGATANMAAGTYHPALKTIHVGVAPTDFFSQAVYQGGSFREALLEDWLGGQDASYMLDVYDDHPYYDDYWAGMNPMSRMGEMTLPIFHYGGFHDVFAEGTLEGFMTMDAQNGVGEQRLLMGPWTHVDEGAFSPTQGELTYPLDSVLPIGEANPIAWFNRHLRDQRRPLRSLMSRSPVTYYVAGDPEIDNSAGNYWAEAKTWPPSGLRETRLYLGDGTLGSALPASDALSYVHDPANPSPTIGGRELSLPSGPRDQSPLFERDDVLVFESAPLEAPLTVVGMTKALLVIESDAPDTDFTVRLADGYPDGRSMLVSDGILRTRSRRGQTAEAEEMLVPGTLTTIEVEIGSVSQAFDAGHTVQLIVSSSNHRRFKVSHNTDNPFWEEGEGAPALNTIHVGGSVPSQLILPTDDNARARAITPWSPKAAEIKVAAQKAKAGRPLNDGDLRALEYEGGRLLMDALYGQVEIHHTPR